VFLSAEAMTGALDPVCSLTILLNYIFKVHLGEAEERMIYKLDAGAAVAFNKYFNVNRQQVHDVNRAHNYY